MTRRVWPLPHVVYVAFDADDRVLYVGCSHNLPQRMRRHRQTSPWHSLVARMETTEFPDMAEAETVERDKIQALRPIWNVDHNPRWDGLRRLPSGELRTLREQELNATAGGSAA